MHKYLMIKEEQQTTASMIIRNKGTEWKVVFKRPRVVEYEVETCKWKKADTECDAKSTDIRLVSENEHTIQALHEELEDSRGVIRTLKEGHESLTSSLEEKDNKIILLHEELIKCMTEMDILKRELRTHDAHEILDREAGKSVVRRLMYYIMTHVLSCFNTRLKDALIQHSCKPSVDASTTPAEETTNGLLIDPKFDTNRPSIWICQTNPTYGTEREIRLINAGDRTYSWMFDAANRKKGVEGRIEPYMWSEIRDDKFIKAIESMGAYTPHKTKFNLTVGATASVEGSHFRLRVRTDERPWLLNTKADAAKPFNDTLVMVQRDTIYRCMTDSNVYLPPDIVKRIKSFDAGIEPFHVHSSSHIAKFAESWSSVGMKYKYDDLESTMWVKPSHLKHWLLEASLPNKAIVIVAHGSVKQTNTSTHWHGFCFSQCRDGNQHGKGIYVSVLDAVPNSYTIGRGRDKYHTHLNQVKEGTMILGLLIVDIEADGKGMMPCVTNGYMFYHLGLEMNDKNRPNYLPNMYKMSSPKDNIFMRIHHSSIADAAVVYQRERLLFLGRAVAK